MLCLSVSTSLRASVLNLVASLSTHITTTKTLEPDVLISVIAKEADCQKAKYPMCGDVKDRDRDEAMAVVHRGPS